MSARAATLFGVAAATAALAAGGCKKQTPITTNNLERPSAITFLCLAGSDTAAALGIAAGAPIPVADCNPPVLDTSGGIPDGADAQDQLVVLVANTVYGEIAVVKDRVPAPASGAGATDALRTVLLDSDTSVPEYTFIRTGDVPIALATRADGAFAYSADAGTCTMAELDASTVLETDHSAPLPRIPLPGRPGGLVALPAAAGETGLLAVTLPDQGALAIVDPAAWDGTSGDCDAPPPAGAPHLVAVLPLGAGLPGPYRPTRMALDAAGTRLYVADDGEPVWHRVDVTDPAAPAELLPEVSAPGRTGAIAVSADGALVYAADVDHGTLLLFDSAGVLLPENDADPYALASGLDIPGVINDVVFFEGPAMDPTVEPAADTTGPGALFGTFAAVASSNGNVYFVNVAPLFPERLLCVPSGEDTCDVPVTRPLQPPHTVRNGLSSDEAALTNEPTPFIAGSELPFDPTMPDTALPILATDPLGCDAAAAPSLATCFDVGDFTSDRDFGVVLKAGVLAEESGAFTATIEDNPGAERWTKTETWTLTWEGILPGTTHFDGTLLEGAVAETAEIQDALASFCSHGTLGEDVAAPGVPLAVVEVLDPPAGEDCSTEELEVFSDQARRFFPVRTASDASLIVGPYHDTRVEPRDFALRPECFGPRIAYRVRLAGAYAVVGAVTGYLHDVFADALNGGACVDGPDPDPGRAVPDVPTGLATPGCAHTALVENAIFTTGLFFDTCDAEEPGPPEPGTGWTFGVTGGFGRLRINPVVDLTGGVNKASNLVQLKLAPFPGPTELYVVDEGAERVTVWSLEEGFAVDLTRTIQ